MLNKTIKTLLLVTASAVFAAPASATVFNLAADSQWHTFDVDDMVSASGGLEWIDAQIDTGYNNDGSALHFVFNVAGQAILTIVDGGFAGDRFQIFNNGEVLGLTSASTDSYPDSVGTNFDAALEDSRYSQAVYVLNAGQYDITGVLNTSASAEGTLLNTTIGAVSLTAVPVPGALGLFAIGSALLAGVSRRRTV